MPEENFPEVVALSALGIRKGHRYKGKIIRNMYLPLKHFVVFMKVLRIQIDEKPMEWHQHYGNVYFHFNISMCTNT